jgi:hypothetical protein
METFEGPVSLCGIINVAQAHLVKNFLEAEGIKARLSDVTEGESFVVVGAHVWVKGSELARARVVLAGFLRGQAERQAETDWTCPHCGSEVPASFDECDVCHASSGTTNPER